MSGSFANALLIGLVWTVAACVALWVFGFTLSPLNVVLVATVGIAWRVLSDRRGRTRRALRRLRNARSRGEPS